MKARYCSGAAIAALAIAEASTAQARQPAVHRRPVPRLERLERDLRDQAARIDAQQQQITSQQTRLEAQATEITSLRQAAELASQRAETPPNPDLPTRTAQLGSPPPVPSAAITPPDVSQAPQGGPTLVAPVGEAPPDTKVEIASLPEEAGVLTPRGGWYVEPSVSYTRSSANVLVFRGVEIVTGVQVGLLQANSAARDTIAESMDVRYGLTNRLEVEVRAPFVERRDRITGVVQRDQSVTQTQSLSADEIGDVELTARYQLNRARAGWPILIAGATYKTDSGRGPFDIPYDQFGVAQGLATGSGFQAIEPSLSLLLPSDPAVIFGSLAYIHSFGRNIDRDIGGAHVGDVEPGDTIVAASGFGFAINPRFSFSLGYRHNYIFPTYTFLNETKQRGPVLQVGAFTFGWSYALTSRIAFASSFEFGVTSDAPDLNVIFRLPIRF